MADPCHPSFTSSFECEAESTTSPLTVGFTNWDVTFLLDTLMTSRGFCEVMALFLDL